MPEPEKKSLGENIENTVKELISANDKEDDGNEILNIDNELTKMKNKYDYAEKLRGALENISGPLSSLVLARILEQKNAEELRENLLQSVGFCEEMRNNIKNRKVTEKKEEEIEHEAAGEEAANNPAKTNKEAFDQVVDYLAKKDENNMTELEKMIGVSEQYKNNINNALNSDNPVQDIKRRDRRFILLTESSNRIKEAKELIGGLKNVSEITNTNMETELKDLNEGIKRQQEKLVRQEIEYISAVTNDMKSSERWRRNSPEYQAMLTSAKNLRKLFSQSDKQGRKDLLKNVLDQANSYIRAKNGGNENWRPKTEKGRQRYELAKSLRNMTKQLYDDLYKVPGKEHAEIKRSNRTAAKSKKERLQEVSKNLASGYSRWIADDEKREIAANIAAANILSDVEGINEKRRYDRDMISFVSNKIQNTAWFCSKSTRDLIEDIIEPARDGSKIGENVKDDILKALSRKPDELDDQIQKVAGPLEPGKGKHHQMG